MDKALKIFQDMIAHGCERNVITYSSLINACEKSGRWQLALQLFDDMQRDGCHPNVVSYNVLVSTCAQGEPACAAGKGKMAAGEPQLAHGKIVAKETRCLPASQLHTPQALRCSCALLWL